MRVSSMIAIYFVIWWTILFAILPFGNKSQAENGDVAPGTVSSAPVAPRLLVKALVTSLVAAALTGALVWMRANDIDWFDLPIFDYGPKPN